MTFHEIETLLGAEVVGDLQSAVEAAFIASRGVEHGPVALAELLTALLASVVAVPGEASDAHSRAAYFSERLMAIVATMEQISGADTEPMAAA